MAAVRTPFTVITIVGGRQRQLRNQLASIQASTCRPAEHIIVHMEQPAETAAELSGARHIVVPVQEAGRLPLAAARNAGLKAVRTSIVVFLDVDCIISPTLFAGMISALHGQSRLIINALPKYLRSVPESGDYDALLSAAVNHPTRSTARAGAVMKPSAFWSLAFGGHAASFRAFGGFDEGYSGYGAEDTDFALRFARAGMQAVYVDDYVLHQYHPKYDPPLNHLEAIVSNANRFHGIWHRWPMQKWLAEFERQGYIHWDRKRNEIRIMRTPTAADIAACLSTEPY